MTDAQLFPSSPFSEAKGHLSDLMTEVVHQHRLRLIDRHRGKETMLLIGLDDIAALLASYRFEPRVVFDDEEVTARLPELGLLGSGKTVDDALADLAEVLEEYTQLFFDRMDFYLQTDRAGHAPWLLRFAATSPERRLELLCETMEAAPEEETS